MGRPRKFNREGVLEKAIPVFWRNGYAGTSIQDLEAATGVNKSGLYTEFEGKEDLFVAALGHYLQHREGAELLLAEPLGWDNIQAFLLQAPSCAPDQPGCFSINSMRELAMLPAPVAGATHQARQHVYDLLRPNVAAERPRMDVDAVCELIWVFFSGICIELNLPRGVSRHTDTVANFMVMLRAV